MCLLIYYVSLLGYLNGHHLLIVSVGFPRAQRCSESWYERSNPEFYCHCTEAESSIDMILHGVWTRREKLRKESVASLKNYGPSGLLLMASALVYNTTMLEASKLSFQGVEISR
jgi:hypothetical protein